VEPIWLKAANYAGLALGDRQTTLLARYENWLLEEAIPAGGIGPGEIDRIDTRHIGDSLLFASEFPHDASLIWDLGTGVGLPGIPLAIALPTAQFLLVDRSRRRIDLLRRAIRILDLENCETLAADISTLQGETEVIVTRASLPPERMEVVARAHLRAGGVAVMGGSWRKRPETGSWTVREIPRDPLAHTIWLLIMRAE
jgi:16S rRNA (guanine527-N7)-methyltransferase